MRLKSPKIDCKAIFYSANCQSRPDNRDFCVTDGAKIYKRSRLLALRVVLDTNVLVSALWTPLGNPSTIVSLALSGKIIPHFDHRIMAEYHAVLKRPKLSFSDNDVDKLLAEIERRGISVVVKPSLVPMTDESDRKFFDVAKACEAVLITGNKKHYPQDQLVMTPAEFIKQIQ